MRKTLNALYFATAFLGASFLVLIGLLICAQVIGREVGIQVKGSDDLTAWSVVAAGFLPLAYTYRNGKHIRVTLLIEKAGASKKFAEFVVLLLAAFFTGYLSYSAFDMVWDSIRFNDMSHGLLVIPIWIPQVSIPIGSSVLTIAILDDLYAVIRGHMPSYLQVAPDDNSVNARMG